MTVLRSPWVTPAAFSRWHVGREDVNRPVLGKRVATTVVAVAVATARVASHVTCGGSASRTAARTVWASSVVVMAAAGSVAYAVSEKRARFKGCVAVSLIVLVRIVGMTGVTDRVARADPTSTVTFKVSARSRPAHPTALETNVEETAVAVHAASARGAGSVMLAPV